MGAEALQDTRTKQRGPRAGSPARPALPPGVYAAISSFLRFEHPVEEQIYVVGGRKRHLEDSSGYLDEVRGTLHFRRLQPGCEVSRQ